MPEMHTMLDAGPEVLLQLKSEYLLPCVYHFYRDPPQIVRSSGCELFDHTGRRYLDCVSGVGVMSAGHCNPEIIEPAIEQIRTLQHTTTIYLTEPQLQLAQMLAEIAPGNLRRSFFCASGSEAVEAALLLACLHTRRPEIVAMTGSLHGRTRWAMNATGLEMWRSDPFGLDGVHHVPFGDLQALSLLLRHRRGKIAAVIAEPIQGNGGIIEPPADFWSAVRALCDELGVLLIFDEVQTGFNRTGAWFACEHWHVTPDLLCLSKALGNGFPISALMTTDEIAMSARKPAASTYGGNPVCAAAALATIEFHRRHDLGRNARLRGQQLARTLHDVARRSPERFGPPRGRGLMLGLPILQDGKASSGRTDDILENLKDAGVLAGKTGPERNVLGFMPPLIIDQQRVEWLGATLEDLLSISALA